MKLAGLYFGTAVKLVIFLQKPWLSQYWSELFLIQNLFILPSFGGEGGHKAG